ncbi:hypothetical protein [Streptomyces sp. NPDC002962]|uniref:hypothetical protein n=1 Tax=Streptomyces sp. NPDC002962 TaxID=3364674 RepID=UPI0036A02DE8
MSQTNPLERAAGVPAGAPGVVVGDTGTAAALAQRVTLLGGHRAWDWFTAA